MTARTVTAWAWYFLRLVWFYIKEAAAVLVRAYQIGQERAAHAYDRIEPWEWAEDPTEEPEDLEMLREQKQTLCLLLESIKEELTDETDRRRVTALLTKQATTQNT